VVDSGTGCLGLKLLPLGSVKNVGVEFVTIASQQDLKSFADSAASLKDKLSSIQLIGVRAISGEGFTIGSVTEMSIDEKTGAITELKISDSANIANDNIVAITAKMITTKNPSAKAEEPEPPAAPAPAPKQAAPAAAAPAEPVATSAPAAAAAPATSSAFNKRSHEFLIGKTATQNITDSQGTVLVKSGETITEETIKMLEGKNELVKLMMNVSKN